MKGLPLLLLTLLIGISIQVDANPNPVITTNLIETYPVEMPELLEYPVYIRSWMEDEPGVEIDRVEVTVNDEAVDVKIAEGYYYILFRPETYGDYTLEMTAYGTNDISSSLSRTVTVTETVVDQTVRTLDDVIIEFGGVNSRWYTGTYELPQHVGAYDKVLAHFDMECPQIAGLCDDWDRLAWIEIKGHDGEWVELIRYITPYGVGCDHMMDVTPLVSLLQGSVEFRVFIDTWGTGGWQLTLDLEHQEGSPLYPYSRVDKIWDGAYDFGNPADLQPVPMVNYEHPLNARQSRMYLTNTGHGWGENNSFNAAEFYHGVHHVQVDGIDRFTHDHWWNCDPNPDGCTGQGGTWWFDRAGWCPGAIARPETYLFTFYMGTGPLDLSYIFHEGYVDNCHANNPNCVSGVTCTDCNDGYNPIYYVDAIMVSLGDVPLLSDDYTEPPPLPTGIFDQYIERYKLMVYPNPTSGKFQLSVPENMKDSARVSIYAIDGSQLKAYYFNSPGELEGFEFDISDLATGNYFVKMSTNSGEGFVEVSVD